MPLLSTSALGSMRKPGFGSRTIAPKLPVLSRKPPSSAIFPLSPSSFNSVAKLTSDVREGRGHAGRVRMTGYASFPLSFSLPSSLSIETVHSSMEDKEDSSMLMWGVRRTQLRLQFCLERSRMASGASDSTPPCSQFPSQSGTVPITISLLSRLLPEIIPVSAPDFALTYRVGFGLTRVGLTRAGLARIGLGVPRRPWPPVRKKGAAQRTPDSLVSTPPSLSLSPSFRRGRSFHGKHASTPTSFHDCP